MNERGFGNRNLMPDDEVDWITADDETRRDLIIIGAESYQPGLFSHVSEEECFQIVDLVWSVCKSLKIFDRIPVFNYCIGSVFCGAKYHLDMRWGNNIALMKDFSLSASARVRTLNKRCWDRYMICFGQHHEIIIRAADRLLEADISSYLPAEIDSPYKYAEGFCRAFWPEFIDIMPENYFPLMSYDMDRLCDKYDLKTNWDLSLCLVAAAVLGEFFMEDGACADFRAMLLDKTGPQGRDKAVKILETLRQQLMGSAKMGGTE